MGTTPLADDTPESVTIENGSVAMLTVTVTGEAVSVTVTVDAPAPPPHSDSLLRQCQSDLDLMVLAQADNSGDASHDVDRTGTHSARTVPTARAIRKTATFERCIVGDSGRLEKRLTKMDC